MAEIEWQPIYEAIGELQAELLRGVLQAQGISVLLSEESIGRTYGFSIAPLGTVLIYVPSDQFETATQILVDYEQGKFAAPDEPDLDEIDLESEEEPDDSD